MNKVIIILIYGNLDIIRFGNRKRKKKEILASRVQLDG